MDIGNFDSRPASILEYIKRNPSSALSTRWVFDLPEAEQEECLVKMIENAAFPETWMVYFDYAERNRITVTDDIALEAIHSVGLDPHSAPLWLKVIDICCGEGKKRELFHMALQVPLYQQNMVYKVYRTFESDAAKRSGEKVGNHLALSDINHFSEMLKTEPRWPDRFVDSSACSSYQRNVLCSQWNILLQTLLGRCDQDSMRELHLRRAELAFRQMCSQFPNEDVCWYTYACFMAVKMNDHVQALEILKRGRASSSEVSVALWLAEPLLNRDFQLEQPLTKDKVNAQLFIQRLYANTARNLLQNKKCLRDIGKRAVAENVSDWKLYHQWASAERSVLRDQSMTSKIYERGISCVSKSPKDAILFSNEAMKYHLWRQDERQVVGYSELQIELLSTSQHDGWVRAGWNYLVNAESMIGLPSLPKTLDRRAERNNDLPYKSIIERYRVGSYIPCADRDLDWIEFVNDITRIRREEQEHIFQAVTPIKNSSISVPAPRKFVGASPDTSLWCPIEMAPKHEGVSIKDPDEIVGPRYLRGRLVYKLTLDDKTAARLRREEYMRGKREGMDEKHTPAGAAQSALQLLVERLGAKRWNETQLRLCRLVSAEWLMNTLAMGDLDLAKKKA